MKTPFYSLRFATSLFSTLALVAATHFAAAQVRPTHRPDVPAIDRRSAAARGAERTAERAAGKAHLLGQLPSAAVEFDPVLDTPKFIRANDGLLTGPNGQGRGVSASTVQALPANDSFLPVKAFLNEHRQLFGYGADVLNGANVKRDYVDQHNGVRTVIWEQKLDGIPVFESVLMGHTTKQGELASLSSSFLPNLASSADSGTSGRAAIQAAPPVSAVQAVALGAGSLGAAAGPIEVVAAGGPSGDGGYLVFKTPEAAYVREVWFPLNRSSLRLGWEVLVTSHTTRERFRLVVDAQNGEILLRQNLTRYISDATYNVFTSDSPSPFTPGLPTPGNFQPPLTNRFMVTTQAFDVVASPEGWIPDADNTTTGNNADAYVDRNFDGQPDTPRPLGVPNRVFDFPLDLTLDPTNYIPASTVQMFYWLNAYHDLVYGLGFTEAAGNYQENNFGRGGLGNDSIICYIQAGADLGIANNAFFAPAPDGFNGQIAMFIWDGPTPFRDGDLDADVILHEATHGTSERLVGGGVLISELQTGGMGEGWSDFYALSINSQAGDDPDAAYPAGGYASYLLGGLNQNYYYGIRHFPYSTDMSKNPFTFKDIDPSQISPHIGVPRSPIYPFNAGEADEVHHQGEIWCTTLWEVRANLIHKYGAAGNHLMLQLVTDGMKLGPANPTFLQARDAILLADRLDNGGADVSDIWKGFAKRGMGFSAIDPSSSTTAGIVEAFDLPGLFVDHVVVTGGNGNGVVDFDECNNLQIWVGNNAGFDATNVTGTLSCSTPGVIVVGPLQHYPDLPDGATNANINPFKISTSPAFVCGTPVNCTLIIKCDQLTSTNRFTIPSGVPGVPLRFDSTIPVAIPDASETNSTIAVTNITSGLNAVTVALYLTHTYDADLLLQLIAPDGTACTLSANNGGAGNNYGLACSPDTQRTTFDDAGLVPITGATAPFVGVFQPQTPLSVFTGKAGTNVNGTWRLRVADQAPLDVGVVQCWSLFLTPTVCTDGGGECPGADLALGMIAQPNPVIVGNNLTYTIGITNLGPSSAKNVTVTHLLPSSVIFVTGNSSQGTVSQSAGLVTASLGTIGVGGTAWITVVVLPNTQGTISSTASVTSIDSDPDTSNNSATVVTQVIPPAADLAVGLTAIPNPLVLGGSLTLTVSVTNNGPSAGTGVTVTNALPGGLSVISAIVSQGSITTGGNLWTIGSLASGDHATATIVAFPTIEGNLLTSSTVQGNQLDPNPANNTSVLPIVVGPSADLAIGITDFPDPVVVLSNLTYVVAVTNLGPSAASSVQVSDFLPANVVLKSTTPSQGVVSVAGNAIDWTIGSLAGGAKVTLNIVVGTTNLGILTSSATVVGAQPDPNLVNNSASSTTTVAAPGVSIAAAGATLTAESVFPPNGAIDVGETVTIILRLRNSSNVSTLNLVGTLMTNSSVVPSAPNNPQSYGVLAPSGFPVGRSFTFTAVGTNGGTVSPTLLLRDGATTYPPVTFTFTLPITYSFTNANSIAIRDFTNGLPYPATINVSGLTGIVGKVTATLFDLNHSFPQDIDALLVAPGPQDSILLAGAGAPPVTHANVTFDDSAASAIPDNTGQILSGSYRPASYMGDFNMPGPAPAGPYPAAMTTFNAANPNGTWSLYVADHTAGDTGSIAGGWGLSFSLISPVNQLADLALSAIVAPDPCLLGGALVYTFTVANSGPSAATSVAFTNTLPAGVTLFSATPSQGITITNATTVIANLGTLNTGAVATVTVVVVPTANALAPGVNSGPLTSLANVNANENDPNPANNSLSAVSTLTRPLADLAVAQNLLPNPGTTGFMITNTIVVTNLGPGPAVNILLTNKVPAGAALISVGSSVGSCATNPAGTLVTCALGSLAANSSAIVSIVLSPSIVGLMTNTVSVATDSQDNNQVNNTATNVVTILSPTPAIIGAGANLTFESGPVNGMIDPGETVTLALSLANIGTLDTVNLRAALQASGGVTSPSGPQNYGTLVHGGAATARSFTFTAGAPSGANYIVTLQLQDERPGVTNGLGTVAFNFALPTTSGWANTNAITIPDHGIGLPYPSTISVSGLLGLVTKVTVTLNGFSHAFPRDVSALLVSPTGNSVLLMSHAGGGYGATNLTFTLDDASTNALPLNAQLVAATYKPGSYPGPVVFPGPTPAPPYGSALNAVNGHDPNGTWSLFVLDDSIGDAGSIARGWALAITTANVLVPVADLAVGLVSTPSSLYAGGPLTNTISVTNFGPSVVTGLRVTNSLSSGEFVITNLGSLAVGGRTNVTLVLRPALGGQIISTATVVGDQADLSPVNNTAQSTVTVMIPAQAVLSGEVIAGEFHLTVTAQPSFTYAILVSSNLTTWTSVSTNTASAGGIIKFTDTSSSSLTRRFYRTKRLAP